MSATAAMRVECIHDTGQDRMLRIGGALVTMQRHLASRIGLIGSAQAAREMLAIVAIAELMYVNRRETYGRKVECINTIRFASPIGITPQVGIA